MRLVVTLEGKVRTVDVDADRVVLAPDGEPLPIRIVQDGDDRTELEIAGERVVIEGWRPGRSAPPSELIVNGERFPVTVERGAGPRATAAPATPTSGTPTRSVVPTADGIAVVPPMPGRVVELRVREGDVVARGAVLVVVEAMKMRNEIASPADGTVAGLAVAVGQSVRGRETMLRIVPR